MNLKEECAEIKGIKVLKIKARLVNIQRFEVPTYVFVVNTATEGMVCSTYLK